MKKPTDQEILRALINQVMKAADGRNEQEVVTFITKPMWRAFLRATGTPESSEPTEWSSGAKCCRVYGSKTVVLPSKQMKSASFSISCEWLSG